MSTGSKDNKTQGQKYYANRIKNDPFWNEVRNEVRKRDGSACSFWPCDNEDIENHHLDYSHLGTKWEAGDVVRLCHMHHMLCHYWMLGIYKVPLDAFALKLRYYYLRLQPWRRIRPSQVALFIINLYKV